MASQLAGQLGHGHRAFALENHGRLGGCGAMNPEQLSQRSQACSLAPSHPMIECDGLEHAAKHRKRPRAARPWVRDIKTHFAPRDQNWTAAPGNLHALLIS